MKRCLFFLMILSLCWVEAATILNQTYSATFLKNNALFPTRTPTLTASSPAKIEFGTGGSLDRLMQYQILAAGTLSSTAEYLVKLTIYGADLVTADNDFALALFDGTNTIGFCRSDAGNGFNHFFENNVYTATTNPAMVAYPTTFGADLLINSTTTVTGRINAATETRVSTTTLNRSAAWSIVLVANDSGEQYRFESIQVQIEGPAVPEGSSLLFLGLGLLGCWLTKKR